MSGVKSVNSSNTGAFEYDEYLSLSGNGDGKLIKDLVNLLEIKDEDVFFIGSVMVAIIENGKNALVYDVLDPKKVMKYNTDIKIKKSDDSEYYTISFVNIDGLDVILSVGNVDGEQFMGSNAPTYQGTKKYESVSQRLDELIVGNGKVILERFKSKLEIRFNELGNPYLILSTDFDNKDILKRYDEVLIGSSNGKFTLGGAWLGNPSSEYLMKSRHYLGEMFTDIHSGRFEDIGKIDITEGNDGFIISVVSLDGTITKFPVIFTNFQNDVDTDLSTVSSASNHEVLNGKEYPIYDLLRDTYFFENIISRLPEYCELVETVLINQDELIHIGGKPMQLLKGYVLLKLKDGNYKMYNPRSFKNLYKNNQYYLDRFSEKIFIDIAGKSPLRAIKVNQDIVFKDVDGDLLFVDAGNYLVYNHFNEDGSLKKEFSVKDCSVMSNDSFNKNYTSLKFLREGFADKNEYIFGTGK